MAANCALELVPPENGVAYFAAPWFGRVYGFMVTAVLWLLQAAFFLIKPRLRQSEILKSTCRKGAKITATICAALLLFGLFGWISGDRAIEIASRFLQRQGRLPPGKPSAVWSWSCWTVQFGNGERPFVEVSRAGALMGGRK